ncbi:MAG: VanZ family protein [Planctomycetaceae bacterium]|nr:VanZ family protein [Planctomycetaceae bacterium]
MSFCETKWLQRWSGVVLLVYLTALITGTHLPHPEDLISVEGNDKWLHFGAYFGLAFLMATRLWTLRTVTWPAMLAIGCLVALTGVVDELTQMLPGINRQCEFFDWLADLAGAVCGLLVWQLCRLVLTRCGTESQSPV